MANRTPSGKPPVLKGKEGGAGGKGGGLGGLPGGDDEGGTYLAYRAAVKEVEGEGSEEHELEPFLKQPQPVRVLLSAAFRFPEPYKAVSLGIFPFTMPPSTPEAIHKPSSSENELAVQDERWKRSDLYVAPAVLDHLQTPVVTTVELPVVSIFPFASGSLIVHRTFSPVETALSNISAIEGS